MKPCFSLQIFFVLIASALVAQTTLQDLPNEPASAFGDAITPLDNLSQRYSSRRTTLSNGVTPLDNLVRGHPDQRMVLSNGVKLSRDLEKLRPSSETHHDRFTPFRPITASARQSQRRLPNDLVIGQTDPNEVVTITGSYVLPGNLIIMNNGVLNLNNANFHIAGNLTILGNGRLNATGGAFTVLQGYAYEHGAQVLEKGRLHFNGVNFSSSGQSWGLGVADSAQYLLENSKISDGFITTGFSGRAAGFISNTQTSGEFLCFGENKLQFHGCDFLVLWLVLFDSSAVDMSLPSDSLLNGWRFSAAVPGVSGIPYAVAIDSCTNINWGLISYSGSDATFRNTRFRVAGLLFQQPVNGLLGPDSMVVRNITNGSRHADEVIAVPDRKLRLINSEVTTWNFYPADSKLTIQNCVFGEMIAQGSARVIIDNSICDGSGGYVGAFDQSFTVIFRSLMNSQVISGGNAILVGVLSAFNSTEIDADEASIMVILNTATLVEPQAHTAAIIFQGQLPPVEGRTESMVALIGTVRLLAGPLNPIRLQAYKVEYAQNFEQPLWQPTDGLHTQPVVNDTLALWNTVGLRPGPYALRLTMYHSFGDSLAFDSYARLEQVITGVHSSEGFAPLQFALAQNYPNPFNPVTTIRYALPKTAHVRLKIFDVLGREVATVVDEFQSAGIKDVRIDGRALAGGIYFYSLTAGEFSQTRKAVLIK